MARYPLSLGASVTRPELTRLHALFSGLSAQLDAALIRRGRSYRWQVQSKGAPALLDGCPGARWLIQGSAPRPYTVDVMLHGAGLRSSCDCPYFQTEHECKHLAIVASHCAEELFGGRVPPALADMVEAAAGRGRPGGGSGNGGERAPSRDGLSTPPAGSRAHPRPTRADRVAEAAPRWDARALERDSGHAAAGTAPSPEAEEPGSPPPAPDAALALAVLDRALERVATRAASPQAAGAGGPGAGAAPSSLVWRVRFGGPAARSLALTPLAGGEAVPLERIANEPSLRATPQDARVAAVVRAVLPSPPRGIDPYPREDPWRRGGGRRRRGRARLGWLERAFLAGMYGDEDDGCDDEDEGEREEGTRAVVNPLRLVEILEGHPRVELAPHGRGKARPLRIERAAVGLRVARIEAEGAAAPSVTSELAIPEEVAIADPAEDASPPAPPPRPPAAAYALALTLGGRALEGAGSHVFANPLGVAAAFAREGLLLYAPLGLDEATLVEALLPAQGRFPPAAAGPLVDRLDRARALLPLELPEELVGRPVPPETRPLLRMTPVLTGGTHVALRVRPIPGGPALAPGEGIPPLAALVGGERLTTERDLAAEVEAARARAAAIGLPLEPPAWGTALQGDALLDLLARLEGEAGRDLAVEWPEGALRRRVARPFPDALKVAVRESRDWFDLDGFLEVEGARLPVADLLAAARGGARYVEVGAGTHVALADLLGGRLGELSLLARGGRGGAALPRAAAALAAEILPPAVEGDPAWRRCLARVEEARRLEVAPPDDLGATLREYQVEGYRWLRRMAVLGGGCCLADEMGLGKTVQAIALLLARRADGPALVVAPTSVGFNWEREIARFAPSLRARALRESDREALLREAAPGDVVIASYGLARLEVEPLAKVAWGTLVLDEAQQVKNAWTETAKAVRAIPAGFVLALTGTPLENRLSELHSLFERVAPGLLGSREEFAERFVKPIEGLGDAKRRASLARIVRPFILRRRKTEVLAELPSRTEARADVELSPRERAIYEAERLAILAKVEGVAEADGEDARFIVLAGLTRLREVACHARLVDRRAPKVSAKVAELLERLAVLREEGRRALVVSQFTRHLDLVREALEGARLRTLTIEGKTPPRERERVVDAFQGGLADVLLVSLRAGGTGLNLTAADTVFLLDPWWNPAVEDQAGDRAHRIGQTRAVTIVRLVARGTVEEKVLALHAEKRDLVEGVLDGTERAGKLSVRELVALIREGAEGGTEADADAEPATRASRRVEPPEARPGRPALRLLPAPQREPSPAPSPTHASAPADASSPEAAPSAAPAPPPAPSSGRRGKRHRAPDADLSQGGAAAWDAVVTAFRVAARRVHTRNTIEVYAREASRIAAATESAAPPLERIRAFLEAGAGEADGRARSSRGVTASAALKLIEAIAGAPAADAARVAETRELVKAYRMAGKEA
jgi:superfamily II DNA or RNA helicase